jgi:MFS family permease
MASRTLWLIVKQAPKPKRDFPSHACQLENDTLHVEGHGAVRKSQLVDRSPVHYGWVILFAGALGLVMTSPGQTYAISICIEYFIHDLGLSRSLVSTLYTIGTVTASFVLPLVGRQIDRRGSRLVIVIIAVLFGLACLYMGVVHNAVTLGVGFFALRLLGQGSLSLVSRTVINQWWVRRRGFAIGIVGMGYALLGRGGFPILINGLIPLFGWRGTYCLLGLMLLLGMAPLGYLLVRDRPEAYGLQPDGRQSTSRVPDRHAAGVWSEDHWTLSEAMHVRVFWLIVAGFASMSMLSTALTFHIVSIFTDGGLTPTIAASAFVPIAMTSAIVQLGSGVLIDRIAVRILLAAALFLHAIILLMAPHLHSIEMAWGFGVIMGTASGLQMTIGGVVWAMYFGRRHLGSIAGLTATISVAASALGPMLFGIARDVLGSYTFVSMVSAALPLGLGMVNLLCGRPPDRRQHGRPSPGRSENP